MGGAGGQRKRPGWVFGLELEGLMDSSQAEGGGEEHTPRLEVGGAPPPRWSRRG